MPPPTREFGLSGAARRWWVVLAVLVGLSAYLYLGGGERRAGPEEATRFGGPIMGTTYSVVLGESLAASARDALAKEVHALLVDINKRMSTYDPDSELSRFNRHASTEPVSVSPELAEVVRMAQEVSRASGGAFDVTVQPLVDAWGFGPSGRAQHALDEAELEALRARVGYTKLTLEGTTLQKAHPELQVDLSAIAKGYAVDRVAALLEARGHRNYLVEIGGELRGLGRNRAGRPFRVGIEAPVNAGREVYAAVELSGAALATSGNYRNTYELEGERRVHTLDPRTGRPVQHKLLSASVLHESCALADAWATALMATGPDGAYALAQKEGLSVLLLVAGEGDALQERTTPGFAARRVTGAKPTP